MPRKQVLKDAEAVAGSGSTYIVASIPARAQEGPKAILRRIMKGMPYREALELQEKLGVDKERFAILLHISPRTFERRRIEGKLDSPETDRALRLAWIAERALGLFEGDSDAVRAWLGQSLPALEGLSPMELIETDAGAFLVDSLIGRMDAGVFS